MRRRISFRVLPLLASVGVLAAAGSSMAGAAVKAHPAAVTKVSVKASEYKFVLSATSLAKPGTVTFTVKNAGHIAHDFSIDKKKTALLSPGKSATLTIKFTKAGSYPYQCTVSGHAALGMKGTFKVK
jgi:uncharacterized cupredoxin-like copper-binding protein